MDLWKISRVLSYQKTTDVRRIFQKWIFFLNIFISDIFYDKRLLIFQKNRARKPTNENHFFTINAYWFPTINGYRFFYDKRLLIFSPTSNFDPLLTK